MERNKVITFDVDDTLFKERDFVESGFRSVAQYMYQNFAINEQEFYQVLIDILNKNGRGKIFDSALEQYNIVNNDVVEKLLSVYREHVPTIKVFDGLLDMLERLRERYQLAIITDGMAQVQRNKVRILGVEKFFDAIVYSDDFKEAKPSPVPFKKVSELLKADFHNMMYVGDNPHKDFIGAKKLGIATVRVRQGMFSDVTLGKEYEADYETDNVLKIEKIIKDINF